MRISGMRLSLRPSRKSHARHRGGGGCWHFSSCHIITRKCRVAVGNPGSGATSALLAAAERERGGPWRGSP